MLSIFTPVYETLIGADPLNPEYREGLFSSAGIVSMLISLIICFVFYIALGRWKPVFHKSPHWLITLAVNAILGFYIAYALTSKDIGAIDGYALRFAFINAFYTGLYFCIFSIVFKRFSIFARHSPL